MPTLVQIMLQETGRNRRFVSFFFDKSRAVQLQGGFRDTLARGEYEGHSHEKAMHDIITATGIPGEHIPVVQRFANEDFPGNAGLREFLEFNTPQWTALRNATRVVHIPSYGFFS